ncbi:helix-turn-helix domain-containing protein [Bradyrhizobium sp. 6(2017)]|uniref:helix-turn-helix domain-containing protein n=1 Tax=Bradyrhizobium sp. 6(2017) TaxID=1197460 RepID=UPI00197A84DC|nr:AraC family transcriptional regulator [Bradyrhizobium sp. 6(2017)]
MSVQTCNLQPMFAQPVSGRNDADDKVVFAKGLPALPCASHEIESDDDVIRSLLHAMKVALQGNDRQSADALQLAIAVRQFGLRPAHGGAAAVRSSTNGRHIQALQKWRLKRVVDYIDARISSRITLADLAAVAGLSRMHFASQFRVATGLRPHEFLLRRRVRRAEELIRETTMTIVEIALAVGFQTQAHFTTVFKRFAGCTPRRWRSINDLPALTSGSLSLPTSFEKRA